MLKMVEFKLKIKNEKNHYINNYRNDNIFNIYLKFKKERRWIIYMEERRNDNKL